MDYAGQNMEKGGDSMVYVRISDTGKGVSSKIMAKLFQKLITDSHIEASQTFVLAEI
jgi:signal transduction histidine kinase